MPRRYICCADVYKRQHIDSVLEPGDVDHPERAVLLPYPNLAGTLPDGVHWLPIVGIEALLNQIDLMSRLTPRGRGKVPEIAQGGSAKLNGPGASLHQT